MSSNKIRLTKSEIEAILRVFLYRDPDASVYLYGSRVNSDKKEGKSIYMYWVIK